MRKKRGGGTRIQHFFGSVTYFQKENSIKDRITKYILIDGQQRITTTMLFLAASRDVTTDDELKDTIEFLYLKNESVSSDTEYKIKLKQVESDWEAYKNIILSLSLTEENKESTVYNNYHYFVKELKKCQNEGIEIINLIQYGLNEFSFVGIELFPERNPWEQPQEIFESMNSQGKPLSLADLVRNYLLMKLSAEDQTRLYNSYWLGIEKTIPGSISDFIRDYMQMSKGTKYNKASDKNTKLLYSQFKDLFDNYNSEKLLMDLRNYSTIYSYIIGNEKIGSEKINVFLEDFRAIKVTTLNSFLMRLLKMFDSGEINESDTVRVLQIFRNYIIRRRIIKLPQGENRFFPTLVNYLNGLNKEDDKISYWFNILRRQSYNLRFPNNTEVQNALLNMDFYSFEYNKYILAIIEEYHSKQRPDINNSNLSIEHILPQTLTAEWAQELSTSDENVEQLHSEYLNKIGNLTLIRHNSELGNKSFKQKKIIYQEKSGMVISTQNIIENEHWGTKEIDKRGSLLCNELCYNILNIPQNMRKANNYIGK